MDSHNHKPLENINVVTVMPGDVAVSLSNVLSYIEENGLVGQLLFCHDTRSHQRYNEYTAELREKILKKVNSELDGEI